MDGVNVSTGTKTKTIADEILRERNQLTKVVDIPTTARPWRKKFCTQLKIHDKKYDAGRCCGIQEIAKKYSMASFIAEYPEWFVDKMRDSIWDIMRDMLLNITRAYSVWAVNIAEAWERRNCMDRAIADCESLLKELELAIDILPVDAEKYMRYVEQINEERALLKGWRKSYNKTLRELE